MSAHLGVQLASYLLSRATIQTAVVMATGLGTQIGIGKNYRHAACELQLGALKLTPPILDMHLEEFYETEKDSPYKSKFTNWFDVQRQSNTQYFQSRKDLSVDLVLTPIDGAKALCNGESGSVSVAAAAPHDETGRNIPFRNPCPKATGYLVIAVGRDNALSGNGRHMKIKEASLTDLQKSFPLLQKILKQASNHEHHVLGVMFDAYENFMPELPAMQCIRRLQGSAVAAALAVFVDKLPYSIFFSRLPQVMQASVAAQGLKCQLYAIPLVDHQDRMFIGSDSKQNESDRVDSDIKTPRRYDHVAIAVPRVFRETDFVKSTNAVVSCTSISEVCVLDRVRFSKEDTATTDTLTVSLVSGRTSRQNDHVPPSWIMRSPDGKEVRSDDLMEAYKKYLSSPDKYASVQKELERLPTRRR